MGSAILALFGGGLVLAWPEDHAARAFAALSEQHVHVATDVEREREP